VTAAVETRGGLDITERRDSLLALIKRGPRKPITTRRAQDLYSVTPWTGIGRNAARRDLRDLARRGQIIPITIEGRRAYLVNPKAVDRHPVTPQQSELALLQAIADEGGEWTPGRAKVVLRRAVGTHIYRSVARRRLEDLHRKGLLELHSERPAHCYYTSLIEGGAA
jgi:ribosomal protein S25